MERKKDSVADYSMRSIREPEGLEIEIKPIKVVKSVKYETLKLFA